MDPETEGEAHLQKLRLTCRPHAWRPWRLHLRGWSGTAHTPPGERPEMRQSRDRRGRPFVPGAGVTDWGATSHRLQADRGRL